MKADLKKDLKALYQPPSKDFVEVSVPPASYLAIDGTGDPNTAPAYAAALQALYTAGYSIKFTLKARTGDDFVVGPLEGLWFAEDPSVFANGAKDHWEWTMLIPLPSLVGQADIDAGLASARDKKPELPIEQLRILLLEEGRSLQIMHIGPYDAEAPTLHRLHHELMPQRGFTWNGPHHEIYLSDPRRTAPEKLRTVLRQPVRPIG